MTELTSPKPVAQLDTGAEAGRSRLPDGTSMEPGSTRQAGPTAEVVAPLEVGIDQIVEIAIPFERLKVAVDQPIQFFIELLQGGQSRDRRAAREPSI